MKVNVIVILFQGVIDEVAVFADENKALDFLRTMTGENFGSAEAFAEWRDEEAEGDSKEEYRWYVTEVQ